MQQGILLSLCRKYVYIVGRKGKGHNSHEKEHEEEIICNIADFMHGAYHDAECSVCDRDGNK